MLLVLAHTAALLPAPPHSGYHIAGRRGAFEGWYHRLSLPADAGVPSVWIYSIFDPEEPQSPRHGVGVQLLGAGMETRFMESPTKGAFWADEHALALGHTTRGVPLRQPAPPRAFERFVQGGWQLTATQHQGRLEDGGISWCYSIEPRLGWGGSAASKQYSTAGWLAALPVFEPHYQVVMSHGLATGHVTKEGRRHDFRGVPVYTEKNWGGGSFPTRWFWAQCNAFDGLDGVSLTVAGGARQLPLLGREEDVALVCVHVESEDAFYPFPNVQWEVASWGSWKVEGTYGDLRASVEARAADGDAGTAVVCPTMEGMTGESLETLKGEVTLRLWRGDELLLEATSAKAALEVGGGPWADGWKGSCEIGEAGKAVLGADVPLEQVKGWIPGF
jgi:tocopherol cyclase